MKVLKSLFFLTVFGGLEMNKPDFSSMTRKELKDYAMTHRNDDAVFTELIERAEKNPSGKMFSYNMTPEEENEAMEIIRRKAAGEKRE
jgi:hypothetical protein